VHARGHRCTPCQELTRLALIASLALLLALASDARANGRFPAASMLVARPGDPSHLVLRATFGLLVSKNGGADWDWICEGAVGYGGVEDPSIAVTRSGAILVGTSRGFARSTDEGCRWEHDPRAPEGIVDMATRPDAPDRVYAIASTFDRQGDAGPLFRGALFVSDDAGATWQSRAAIDPTLSLDTVEVAPSDPLRVYVSGVRSLGKAVRGALLVSSDDGRHFVEESVPLDERDRGVYIGAVDPARAERVYLRTSGDAGSRLLVTDDAGGSLREVFRGGPLLGFALGEDGGAVYAGGPNEGLLAASSRELAFAPRSPGSVQCLTWAGGRLWECAPIGSGFLVGASVDGASFSAKVSLKTIRGPLQCAAPSAIDGCDADWKAFRALVGQGAPAPPARARSCGCSLPGRTDPGAGRTSSFLALLLSGFLAFVARSRLLWRRCLRRPGHTGGEPGRSRR
jgi:photosystem II stability/assembly factor-like uncharacterized protein